MRRIFAPLIASLTLGACAMYMQPGTQATAFDGTYAGTVNQTHVSPLSCASTIPKPGQLVVDKGMVVWSEAPSGQLFAPVATDGSFQISSGVTGSPNVVWLTGKITNKEMVARVNTGSCHMIYDLRKNA